MAAKGETSVAGENGLSSSQTKEPTEDTTMSKVIDEDSDTDSLLAKLESELDLSDTETGGAGTRNLSTSPTTSSLLAARKAQLESESASQASKPSGHVLLPAQYSGIQIPSNEEALIRATADAPAALVVFYSSEFNTSVKMRDIVTELAKEYAVHHAQGSRDRADRDGETAFFAAEAEKCEWLCRRLKIQILPVVVGYVDGKEVGRIVGFDGLKGGEKANWRILAWSVGSWNVSWSGTIGASKTRVGILGNNWSDWAGSQNTGRDDGGASDSEDGEDERDRRRAAGYIGGGGGSGGRLNVGKRRQHNKAGDDDDDWD